MNLVFSGNGLIDNPSGGLCDEYRVENCFDFGGVIKAYRTIRSRHPGFMPLLSLDDPDQARYTSGHAHESFELAMPNDEELAHLPPECFEDGHFIGCGHMKAGFPVIARNFSALVANATFSGACEHGLSMLDDQLDDWLEFQSQPFDWIDEPLSCLLVPARNSSDALAAFPNGYFQGDLTPAHNWAVAEHLREAFGYELIGVGATSLGFLRDGPADQQTADAVSRTLCELYNIENAKLSNVAGQMAAVIVGQEHLIVRYIDG